MTKKSITRPFPSLFLWILLTFFGCSKTDHNKVSWSKEIPQSNYFDCIEVQKINNINDFERATLSLKNNKFQICVALLEGSEKTLKVFDAEISDDVFEKILSKINLEKDNKPLYTDLNTTSILFYKDKNIVKEYGFNKINSSNYSQEFIGFYDHLIKIVDSLKDGNSINKPIESFFCKCDSQ